MKKLTNSSREFLLNYCEIYYVHLEMDISSELPGTGNVKSRQIFKLYLFGVPVQEGFIQKIVFTAISEDLAYSLAWQFVSKNKRTEAAS